MTVFYTDNLIEIKEVVRLFRLLDQLHTHLLGCPVPFLVIAQLTGNHQVFPAFSTAEMLGNHMIDSQRLYLFTAVLAGVVIPNQQILAIQQNSLMGNFDMPGKADHTGNGYLGTDGMQYAGILFNHLSFAKKNKHYSPFDIANAERFVILIEQ